MVTRPPPRPPRDLTVNSRDSGGGSDNEGRSRGSGPGQSMLVAAATKPPASSVAARMKARADELKGIRVLPEPDRTLSPLPSPEATGPPQATVPPRSMTTRASPKLTPSHTSPRLKPVAAEPTLDDNTEDPAADSRRWGRSATAEEPFLATSAPVYAQQPQRPMRKGPAAAAERPHAPSEPATPFSYTGASSTSPSGSSPVGSWSSGTDIWAGLGAERNNASAAATSENSFEKRSPRGAVPKQRAMFGTQRGLAAAPADRRGPPPTGFLSKSTTAISQEAPSTPAAVESDPSNESTADSSTPTGTPSEENLLSPRGPSNTAGAKGDKRTHIVNEIVSTEKNYIQSIELLMKVFQPALKILINDPGTALKVDDVRRMFSNIDMIIPLNKELLKDLEARVATWSPAQLIGDVFLTHAPYLKMYTDYSNNYNAANKLYLDLIANDLPFYEVMEACKAHQDNIRHESLESVLIMPVQRIPRYNLLLEDLLKNTPPDHADYPNIQKALGKMKEVADHINKSVQQQENLRRLMEASNKGTGFRGLLEAHRKLLRDGTLPISYGFAKKPTDKLHFFLFNDLLVYARPSDVKKQADMSKAETKFPLMLIWIKEHPEGIFEIIAPGTSFGVHPSPDEKSSWLTILKDALKAVYSAQPDCTEDNRFSKYQVYDEGVYEGWWLHGRPHGQGSFALFGNEYTGEWREGMKAGKGTFTYATGEVYEGDWEADVPCGRGVLTHPSGDRYVGEFLRGKKHGRGEFIYIDGARYVGDWKENVASGQGKLTWRNGIVYEGSWADGQFHGYGMITNSRGEMYRGDWVNGKKEGKGVMTWVGSSYDGWWKADKFNGQGTHTSEAAKTQYVGQWENGEKQGRGVMTYPDGSKYDGEWKSGERHGKGALNMANGDRYVGTFKHGEFHGKGTYTYRNGTKIEGTWEKGVRDGEFTLYLPAMKKLVGVAKDEIVACKLNKEKVDFTLGPAPPVFEFEF